MVSKLENLLGKSKNKGESLQSAIQSKNNLISFSFDGKEYYVAIRDSVLVFDENMALLYNFEMNELATSDNEFIKKVNAIVNENSNDLVHLYINKVTGVEHITFSSLFDATYIFLETEKNYGQRFRGHNLTYYRKRLKGCPHGKQRKTCF